MSFVATLARGAKDLLRCSSGYKFGFSDHQITRSPGPPDCAAFAQAGVGSRAITRSDRRSSAVSFCFRAARAELPLKKSHSCIVMFFSIPNLELSKVSKSISSLLTIQQPIHNPLVQIPWHAKTMIPPEA